MLFLSKYRLVHITAKLVIMIHSEAIQFCSQDALRMHYRQITYEVTFILSDRYKNMSVIVDFAMRQTPRSTERISS